MNAKSEMMIWKWREVFFPLTLTVVTGQCKAELVGDDDDGQEAASTGLKHG